MRVAERVESDTPWCVKHEQRAPCVECILAQILPGIVQRHVLKNDDLGIIVMTPNYDDN